MSFRDTQVDLLLRQYGRDTKSHVITGHLDADELNAFSEGTLPSAARPRCVSHLAECDDCRRLASQLAISAGAVVRTETTPVLATAGASWIHKLTGFFRPPTLRYAAFAAVLIAAVGLAFLAMRQTRRQRELALVGQNEPASQSQVSAIKESEEVKSKTSEANPASSDTTRASASPRPTSGSYIAQPQEESKLADKTEVPAKPQKETAEPAALGDKKATEAQIAESKPSYAPPPPEERERMRAETKPIEQQKSTGAAGPMQSSSQSQLQGGINRQQTDQLSNSNQSKDDNYRVAKNSAPINGRAADEKAKGPRRDVDNVAAANRGMNEARAPAPKTEDSEAGKRKSSGEESETRSVGGHKFRRQGNTWIDAKFKSSMASKSVSRGSEDFAALDSGLRSIAQQLSGEVIVVWKGKAYVIR